MNFEDRFEDNIVCVQSDDPSGDGHIRIVTGKGETPAGGGGHNLVEPVRIGDGITSSDEETKRFLAVIDAINDLTRGTTNHDLLGGIAALMQISYRLGVAREQLRKATLSEQEAVS